MEPPLRALGPNSSGGYCRGLLAEWTKDYKSHFRICLTHSQIPSKGDCVTQSQPEGNVWCGAGGAGVEEFITRVAGLNGKFSHFQVPITLICLHK